MEPGGEKLNMLKFKNVKIKLGENLDDTAKSCMGAASPPPDPTHVRTCDRER